jgi:hypothetical protein
MPDSLARLIDIGVVQRELAVPRPGTRAEAALHIVMREA